jgi:hypothetical protein
MAIYFATETIDQHYRKVGRKPVLHETQEITNTFCSSACRRMWLGNDYQSATLSWSSCYDYGFQESCTNCGQVLFTLIEEEV